MADHENEIRTYTKMLQDGLDEVVAGEPFRRFLRFLANNPNYSPWNVLCIGRGQERRGRATAKPTDSRRAVYILSSAGNSPIPESQEPPFQSAFVSSESAPASSATFSPVFLYVTYNIDFPLRYASPSPDSFWTFFKSSAYIPIAASIVSPVGTSAGMPSCGTSSAGTPSAGTPSAGTPSAGTSPSGTEGGPT